MTEEQATVHSDVTELGEFATINPESLGSDTPRDYAFRYVDLGSVEKGKIDWSLVSEHRFGSAPSRARRVLREGDVLFGTVRPALQSHGAIQGKGIELVGSTGFAVLRSKDGVSNSRFLYHVILSHEITEQAVRNAVGSNYPAVNESDVARFIVPRFPLPEQRKIAEILDTVDATIRQTEALIAKLERMKQGLLHDLLTRGIDDNGELREPVRHPEQFKDTPMGRIPNGWKVLASERVCEEIVVGIVIRPTQYYASDGIPVLRSANVRGDGLDLSDLAYMSDRNHRMLQKSAVTPGTVVTVRTGYPGTTCVIPHSLPQANCVDLIISRPSEAVTPEFLAMWVNSPFGSGQVLRQQGGLAQQHFNIGEMKKLLVAVPHRDEQVRIIEAYSALLHKRRNYEAEEDKLRVLKQGLMDALLTGRVQVSV